MARLIAFWTLAILVFYGSMSLNETLAGNFNESLGEALIPSFPRIPVMGTNLTGAFLIAAIVCIVGIVLLFRFLEKPKYADLLIDTETELRKVTWPTLQEVINSSIVVILCVMFLMGFLAASDWFPRAWRSASRICLCSRSARDGNRASPIIADDSVM